MLIRKLEGMPEPSQVMAALAGEKEVAFLDSSSQGYGLGKYSIFACSPKRIFEYTKNASRVIGSEGEQIVSGDCFDLLREFCGPCRETAGTDLPFVGGAIGFLSYDLAWEYEVLPDRLDTDYELPLARFGYYDAALIYSHEDKVFWGVSLAGEDALDRLIANAKSTPEGKLPFEVMDLKSNFDRSGYLKAVEAIKAYILEGEIYQANFSQRFEARFRGSPWSLYEQLRKANPSPYSAYLKFGEEAIMSSSPERFLQVQGRRATTRPIKGTRPRGDTEREDRRLEEELRLSEKDQAELLMIVDLERNDLGKTCIPGSIEVDELYSLERYARVIHQTANVSGEIEEERDVIDCLKGMFPGGSITGAPKIRAMEVIEELERHKRGIYTGSIGYISNHGKSEFNIAIRTIRRSGDTLLFHAGGGIVWDSDPSIEYEETMHKAKALLEAMGVAEGVSV